GLSGDLRCPGSGHGPAVTPALLPACPRQAPAETGGMDGKPERISGLPYVPHRRLAALGTGPPGWCGRQHDCRRRCCRHRFRLLAAQPFSGGAMAMGTPHINSSSLDRRTGIALADDQSVTRAFALASLLAGAPAATARSWNARVCESHRRLVSDLPG